MLLASLLLKGVKKVKILILRTGSPSSKYDNRHCYVRSKYKDMGEKKIVSVAYERKRISIKIG